VLASEPRPQVALYLVTGSKVNVAGKYISTDVEDTKGCRVFL
jgi:hypothetical protein